MNLRWLRVEGHFLKSRVAKSMFWLFMSCSIVPLAAFAFLAMRATGEDLELRADRELHMQSKAMGMAIIERLLANGDRVTAVARDLRMNPETPLESICKSRSSGWRRHFAGAALFSSGALTSRWGRTVVHSLPKDLDLDRLRDGESAVTIGADREGVAAIHLWRAVDPADVEERIVVFEVAQSDLIHDDERPTIDSQFVLLDSRSSRIIHTSADLDGTSLEEFQKVTSQPQGRVEWTIDDETCVGRFWTVFMKAHFDTSWTIVQLRPLAGIMEPIKNYRSLFARVAALALLIVLLLSLWTIRRRTVPIDRLSEAVSRFAGGRLETRVQIDSKDELAELGAMFNHMACSIESDVRMLESMNAIGRALSEKTDEGSLGATVIAGTVGMLHCHAATLYAVKPGESIEPVIARTLVRSFDRHELEGLKQNLNPDRGHDIAVRVAMTGVAASARDSRDFVAQGLATDRPIDERLGVSPHHLLAMPLQNQDGEVIGILEIINPEVHGSEANAADIVGIAESIASQAAVAITKIRLSQEFKVLFDSLIELIATAIDKKSPYTGGHCRRVPVITMMIADAIDRTRVGPLKDVQFSAEQRYELEVAALLHDCGKVVTPVHVVDKATKLETIHDRIDLVNLRFEILRRDAMIAALERGSAPRRAESDQPAPDVDAAHAELASEIEFLRRANIGGEAMSDDDIRRINDIARRFSYETASGEVRPVLDANEIANLSIRRGTLTNDEREIINHHVVATIEMLEKLPFPKALRNVADIAGCHHEKMDGTGYPNHVKADDIPLQGRILGIADIFEALTAKDRPYKVAMPLTQALTILGRMAAEGQVDPEVYTSFVEDRVYERYAAEYLEPHQIVPVDVSKLPGLTRPIGESIRRHVLV